MSQTDYIVKDKNKYKPHCSIFNIKFVNKPDYQCDENSKSQSK